VFFITFAGPQAHGDLISRSALIPQRSGHCSSLGRWSRGRNLLFHGRDNIYTSEFDSALKGMGLNILKTPFRTPLANAFCERLLGTIRRECLDFLAENFRVVGGILQPEAPAFEPALRRHGGATRFRLRHSVWSPRGQNSHLGRSASRIPAGEGSGLKSEQKITNEEHKHRHIA
jgi:hypothetical protein